MSLLKFGLLASGIAKSPINAGNSLKVWFDFADKASLTFNGSDELSSAVDKSGNGNNATAVNVPLINQNTINNKNVITFDGVNDRLSFPNINGMENESTVFVVYNSRHSTTAISAGHILAVNGDVAATNESQPLFFVEPDKDLICVFGDSGAGDVISEQPNIMVSTYDGIDGQCFINGFNTNSNTITLINSIAASTIGGSSDATSYKGDIAEIIIYNRKLSDDEIKSVNNYLSNKWNINVISIDTPTILGNKRQWVDVDDDNEIVRGTVGMNQQVSFLGDKSGFGDDFVINFSPQQPFWLQADQNGRDTLLFDGTSDIMLTLNDVSVSSNDFTFFLVSKAMTIADGRIYYWFDGSGQGFYQNNNDDGSAFFPTPTILLTQTIPTEFYIAEIIKNGTTATLFINGVQQDTDTVNITAPNSQIFLGGDFTGGNLSNIKFGEAMLFDGVITDLVRNTIRNNLIKKWDII